MKTSYLFIFYLLFTLSLNGQDEIWLDSRLNPTDDKKTANYYLISEKISDSDFSIVIYRMNQTLLMKGNSTDSYGTKLYGLGKWYHENGNIESEGYYEEGSKIGSWKRFDKEGNSRGDRLYSDVNMSNFIFNSALLMPKPPPDIQSYSSYIISKLIEKQAFDIIELMPLNSQFVVYIDGHINEIKLDDNLSNNQHFLLKEIIESIKPWTPGSNGTQNINVRIDLLIKN